MLKKMALNIGGVSFVLGMIMVLAALSSIMLGRTLSQEEFGEFALMRTLVLFIAPIAVWGQDVATARFFSQNDAATFKWGQAYRTILGIGSLIVVAGVIVAAFIYKIEWPRLIALFVASTAYTSTLFFSNLLRSQRQYKKAILMLNGFRGLFFLAVLILFFTKTTAALAIFSYYGIIVLLAFVNARVAFAKVPQGKKIVPKEMHTTGLLFMGSQASVTIIGSLDSLFIPGMLDMASLGLYQAAIVPSQLFNIIGRAGKYVWVPEFGRSKNIKLKKISILVSLTAASLLALLLIFAEPLLHVIFNGKYDAGANVLRILACAGTVRLFYNLGSSLIVGKMEKNALVCHLAVTITMVFVEAGLLFFMLKNYGVLGAAMSVLIVTTLRTLGSFAVVFKFRHQLHSSVK